MAESRKRMYLVTGVTEGYLARASQYIRTMDTHSTLQNVVLTVDFDITQEIRQGHPRVRFVRISSSDVESPSANSCMQHGGFLPALGFVAQEDIILYTDADISVQRGFTDEELDFLGSFSDNEVGAGYNRAENDTLSEEAAHLGPTLPLEKLAARYPGISELATYNTGVIVANRRTYGALYERYNQQWHDFAVLFEHYAKQQWLLSYLMGRHFKVRVLPDAIHTHGHFPIGLRVTREAGYKFCIGSQPVVLNHAIPSDAEGLARALNRRVQHLSRWVRRLAIALGIAVLICVLLVLRVLSRG